MPAGAGAAGGGEQEVVRERGGAPLSARELPALFDHVHDALQARRDAIDDLNVFPVPDGDTGTNMTLTVRAGRDALAHGRADRPAGGRSALAREVIRGAVRGARGNSGVIISQVVRAVVEVTTGEQAVDAHVYAQALEHARELAYEAVAEPVEGTILTAIATAADAARAAVEAGDDLVATSAAACAATAIAVERTREQLDVLREAGVVDAGARGFEVLLAAVHGHLTGEDPPVAVDPPRSVTVRTAGHVCHGSLAHPYEVQYLLDAVDASAAPLRVALEQLGESVVVVAAGGLLNVHVHTDRIGPAIEAGLAHGRPSAIEVVHLGEQVAERDAARVTTEAALAVETPVGSGGRMLGRAHTVDHPTAGATPGGALRPPQRDLAVVAVLHGHGAVALARSLGAEVVDGTAGSLPSVAQLVEAAVASRAQHVVILPGHRNAVAAATSAAEVVAREYERQVEVVDAATSPPAVLAALAIWEPDAQPAQVAAELRAAAGAVRAGEVVDAIRDAATPAGPVRAGQPLGLADGDLVVIDDDPLRALHAVCLALDLPAGEVVTLLHGASSSVAQREAAAALVAELAPDAEVEVVDAGLAPARFWVGVE